MGIVAVLGGSGNVGGHAVTALREQGQTVRIVSRHPRPADHPLDPQWATVDYGSGAGLADALVDVDRVICTLGGVSDAAAVRAAAAASAPDTHLIYLSIVGIERLPMFYYRRKLDGEAAVRAADRPWTVLRATQFHSLAKWMLRGLAAPPVMFVPRMTLQPVSAVEVGARLAELTGEPAAGRVPDFGGPEVLDLAEFARQYLHATSKRRRIVRVPPPPRLRAGFDARANVTPDHADGRQTFAQYLSDGPLR